MDSLVSLATAPAAVTTTFSTGLAALIVVLAAYGLYSVLTLEGKWRWVAILLIVGILVVNISLLHSIGVSIRGSFNDLAIQRGWGDLVGDIGFTLLLVILFFVFLTLDRRSQDNKIWKLLMFLTAILFFTLSWAADGIVWLSIRAADSLGWLTQLNF